MRGATGGSARRGEVPLYDVPGTGTRYQGSEAEEKMTRLFIACLCVGFQCRGRQGIVLPVGLYVWLCVLMMLLRCW